MDIIFVVFPPQHGGNHLSNLISTFKNFKEKNLYDFYSTLKTNAHTSIQNHIVNFLHTVKNHDHKNNLTFPCHYYEFIFLEKYFNTEKIYNNFKGSTWPQFASQRKILDYPTEIQSELKNFFEDYDSQLEIFNLIKNYNIKIAVISQDFKNKYTRNRQKDRNFVVEEKNSSYYNVNYKDIYFNTYNDIYHINVNDLFQYYNKKIEIFLNCFNYSYDQTLVENFHNQWFNMIKKSTS